MPDAFLLRLFPFYPQIPTHILLEGGDEMLERTTYQELRRKEVINVCDGARLGTICDLELDACTGTLIALIVPGPPRFFGLIRGCDEFVIPFCRIKKLVDCKMK